MTDFLRKARNSIYGRSQTISAKIILPYRKLISFLSVHYFFQKINLKKQTTNKNENVGREKFTPLSHIINGDFAYLDVPDHINIGDHMITKGTKTFFSMLSHECIYQASINSFNPSKINPDTVILLHGGGNFGDLWKRFQNFREMIVQKFPDNRIIILPQTIYFRKEENLQKTINIFSNHKDLFICVRDHKSYELAKKKFTHNTVLLIPDMASFISIDVQKNHNKKTGRVLFINRADKERKENLDLSFIKNITVSDWPVYEVFYYRYLRNKYREYDFFVNEGICYLSNFDLIISTRMHGSVLAYLLDIPVILVDNSYGKSKTFYETWFTNEHDFYFANNKKDIESVVQKKFPEYMHHTSSK